MRRRTFLASLSGTASALGLSGVLGTQRAAAASGTVEFLEFDSSASLLDANRDPLTDDALIAVRAESSAFNVDDDSNGDAVDYGTTDIPLVAVDERANGGADAADCSGWTLSDEGGYTYEFPSGFTLDANAAVTIHTGEGTDTTTDLYWGYGMEIWNDGGDTATLEDDAGTVLDTYSY